MADYDDYQGELEVIDEGDEYSGSAAPSDSITPVIIILTTIFTIIGMVLIGWELFNIYDLQGNPKGKNTDLLKITPK